VLPRLGAALDVRIVAARIGAVVPQGLALLHVNRWLLAEVGGSVDDLEVLMMPCQSE
jgi:hypothetical protein